MKQLRLRIIIGTTFEEGLLYSDSFNLMDPNELSTLKTYCVSHPYIAGFLIEKSNFVEGTYKDSNKSNEFQPLLEFIAAENNQNSFTFRGDEYAKMAYHVIVDSILDPRAELLSLLSIIKLDNIEETAELVESILKNHQTSKRYHKLKQHFAIKV